MSKKDADDDVVMKDADKKKGEKEKGKEGESKASPKPEEKKEEIKLSPREAALKEIKDTVVALQAAVTKQDRRLLARVDRAVESIRKKLRLDNLTAVVKQYYPEAAQTLALVEGKVQDPVEEKVELPAGASPAAAPAAAAPAASPAAGAGASAGAAAAAAPAPDVIPLNLVVPEVKVFIHLLAAQFVIDKRFKDEGVQAATSLLRLLQSFNRRTLDLLSARVFFLYSLAYERVGHLDKIRAELLTIYRTACLQHNEPGQCALINAILRNYVHYGLFEQADNFRSKSHFPDARSNNQNARFLFYRGRINAVKLHYSDAYADFSEAIRKAPVKSALGFRQKANKFQAIVQLLMGEIPDRAMFRQADLKKSLKPYFRLTQAVRVGDLAAFNDVVHNHKKVFIDDHTYSLIVRLRHNVIKTGLRKINLSYSRISISDICKKLNIPSEEDAEYIVAKAIHDGVIDAVIDRKQQYVFSKENTDVYSTNEPQAAFDRRIDFCNKIHTEAVKALAFPPNAHKVKTELDAMLEAEDHDQDDVEELAKKAEEEDDD